MRTHLINQRIQEVQDRFPLIFQRPVQLCLQARIPAFLQHMQHLQHVQQVLKRLNRLGPVQLMSCCAAP